MDLQDMVSIVGTGISPGLALGEACLYRDPFEVQVQTVPVERHDAAKELARLDAAIGAVAGDLQSMARDVTREMDAELAAIFDAHFEILNDRSLQRQLRNEIDSFRINAEHAVQRIFRQWEQSFADRENEMLRHRAGDFADLGRRLLQTLAGVRSHALERIPSGCVLVTRRLLPSEAVRLQPLAASAVVVEEGGTGSHCALLTRAMGIPAVVVDPGFMERIQDGDLLMVDGRSGSVIVHPNQDQIAQCRQQMRQMEILSAAARQSCRNPARTRDGVEVTVLANISSLNDAETALANGADGVGLYRVEMYYLGRSSLPCEDDLVEEFQRSLALFPDSLFCIRLLDLGGDKNLSFLRTPVESNPNLGRRGIRFLKAYPELLRTQLRALLRLAQDRELYVLVPMVTFPEDLATVRTLLETLAAQGGFRRRPKIGPMIETPAAALSMPKLEPLSDFFSVGTNDLTQYLMAADRENPLVRTYYQDGHPIMVDLIRQAADQAAGKLIGVCGELAGKEEGIPLLLHAGIRILSVAPARIPEVKQTVRQCALRPPAAG